MTTTYIDLFCGIGSFHYSFKPIGWKCVMACDIDPIARKTYFDNYGIEPMGDIKQINPKDIPSFDILCAGFPCQSVSQIGLKNGFDDPRGALFFDIIRFVKACNPKIIILENVPALLTHNDGETFGTIRRMIENEGYSIEYKILKCSDYGIPQMRKRIFIIATKPSISNILKLDEYKLDSTLSQYLGKNFEKQIAYTIRCGGRSSPILDKHNWDGYMVDGIEYRLTISDGLRLQGFSPNFKLSGSLTQQWKQLGNTIPTIFTKIIGERIHQILH